MGFWPFGGGKKNRRSTADDPSKRSLIEKSDPGMARTPIPAEKPTDRATRSTSKRGRDEKSRKLSKSHAADAYKTPSTQNLPRSQTAPLSSQHEYSEKESSPQVQRQPNQLYQQNPLSQSSIGPENFTTLPHPPTLHARRNDFDPTMPRKKSSKRKAEDYQRERELRAMTSEPSTRNRLKRPVTYSGSGPLQRDTRNIPGPMNRTLGRPDSQVSLPLPENISESEDSPKSSFKVGALAALSPRPTLKSYQFESSRSALGKQPVRLPTVHQTAEEDENLPLAKQRINELADDLGPAALRELMERDRRRKEKKKDSDKVKLQRKLQRRAERQREEETRRVRAEEFVSSSQAQLQQAGRDFPAEAEGSPGPAIDDRPSDTTPAGTREAAKVPLPAEEDPFADPARAVEAPSQPIRNPFEDEQDLDVMDIPSEHEDDNEPQIPVKSPLRTVAPVEQQPEAKPVHVALSPPTSPIQQPNDEQSVSQMSEVGREVTPDVTESIERDRRASDQSGQQLSSWTNFFRRGGRRKTSVPDRGRTTPSEFSNTSRESFARKQPPALAPPAARTFRKSESGTPQRTMSKFREDLPEFPISPPDSRVQSPEVAPASQAGESSLSSKQVRQSLSGTLDARSLATSSSNPALDRGRPESRLQSVQQGEGELTAPSTTGHAISQSLASVDSEASWLSGKPPKRFSGPMVQPLKDSPAEQTEQMAGAFEPEDEGLADDEYLKRLSPAPGDRRESAVPSERRASSTVIDLQRERAPSPTPGVPPLPQGKDETWHEGLGRQPTVVKQPTRAKSREGLLKEAAVEDAAGSEEEEDDEHSSGEIVDEPQLMRARSVEYKGHIRHVSAGSAKLLDIRRASMQSTDIHTPPRSPGLPHAMRATKQETEETRKPS